MNTKRLKTLFALAILVTTIAIFYLVPAIAQPGDASDPLVTRNFVESRIAQVMDEINNLRTVINNISPGAVYTPAGTGDPVSHPGADNVSFRIERISVGYSLIAHEGAEFILRSGMATAITGANGMVDITAGRDVMNGEQISHNHLLLVPRTDGRGFLANTDVYVMIKGGFDIVS